MLPFPSSLPCLDCARNGFVPAWARTDAPSSRRRANALLTNGELQAGRDGRLPGIYDASELVCARGRTGTRRRRSVQARPETDRRDASARSRVAPPTGDCGRRADAPNTVFAKGTRGSKVSNVTESIDLVLNIVPLASGRLCIANDGMPTCLRNACDALEKR